jgi:peptidoglycan/xylan/chitin deacetylase (PgdA/CDA1 family)
MMQAKEMLANNKIPAKTAVITFDDGYVSFYTRAWPILKEHDFPATVYVITSFSERQDYLNWDQVKLLNSAGIEIGSHSQTHPELGKMTPGNATREIKESKKVLEDNLGVGVNSFCYPCGSFNEFTPTAVKDAGYKSAVTTENRKAAPKDDLYRLPRVRVSRNITINYFSSIIK